MLNTHVFKHYLRFKLHFGHQIVVNESVVAQEQHNLNTHTLY